MSGASAPTGTGTGTGAGAGSGSDSEDDYMKMTFTDDTDTNTRHGKQPETSLQRRQRLKREAEARGRVKSKAELAAEEEARREAALSRSLLESSNNDSSTAPKKSKGLAMMARMGFTPGSALGSKDNAHNARTEPIRISVKDGREGVGLESERKRKLREAAEAAGEAAKRAKVDELEYRDRIHRERTEARMERQVHAVQKVAEGMDEDGEKAVGVGEREGEMGGEDGDDDPVNTKEEEKQKRKAAGSSRPLRCIPLVYRGLVRSREEAERDRRMRYDLEQSSLTRLPTYDDDDEDEDDKKALGKQTQASKMSTCVFAEDLDDEDPELDEFNALPVQERLRKAVEYLREKHRYCFWCKAAYPDDSMDGCPGLTEEDHD